MQGPIREGACSNVVILQKQKISFTVQGMNCSSCAVAIENELGKIKGAVNPVVNFAALRADVEFSNTSVETLNGEKKTSLSPPELRSLLSLTLSTIRNMGFKVEPMNIVRRKFIISGMTCAGCAGSLEATLLNSPASLGIVEASVVFASVSADVSFISTIISPEEIQSIIEKSGYTVLNRGSISKGEGHEAGGGAVPQNDKEHLVGALERKDEIKLYRNKFLGSLVFSAPLMVAMIFFMIHPYMQFEEDHRTTVNTIYMILSSPAVAYFGRDYFLHAYNGLKRLQFTMDTLVAVGVGGAFVFSIVSLALQFAGINATCYFDTAAELITFMLLGKFLEAAAKAKTSDALVLLLRLTPSTATLLRTLDNGTEEVVSVPSSSLKTGDRVRVSAGEKIPVDGTVTDGNSEVDEAAVTGESLPRQVNVGAKVIGGTINVVSVITVTATAVGDDTVVAHIIRIVEEAQQSKPAIQRFADRIAGVFVPCVLIIASSVFVVWCVLGKLDVYPSSWRGGESPYVFAFQNFLSTLVVACPCALGLATPTAIMVGTGVGAEMGVLSKSGIVLETVPMINTFIFDKTGTLTTGDLSVTSSAYFKRGGGLCNEASQCAADLRIIAAVEGMATHPIAVAVSGHIKDELIPMNGQSCAPNIASEVGLNISDHCVIGGKGISALADGLSVRVGTLAFISEVCETLPVGATDALFLMKQQGRTIVLACIGSSVVALFGLSDRPKPEARAVVEHLLSQKHQVMMVTGDNESAALRIAKEVGIPASNVVASCMPANKEEIVSKVQKEGRRVAFIGDGINDSPALAQADVGIALGAGTDIAIECADAVLMHDSLMDIVAFISLAKTVVRRIRFNFCWALCYNIIMLPVAAGVLFPVLGTGLPPVVAGIAMIMSSLSVLMSSLSLRCFKPPKLEVETHSGDTEGFHAVAMDSSSDERAVLTRAVQEACNSEHSDAIP